MVLILSNSRSSRPIRTHLKSINYASKYRIYVRYHYFGVHFTKIGLFCHEKDAQNVVTGWFTTKICSKWGKSSETLHNDSVIFIGSSKHQKQWIWMLLNIILSDFQQYKSYSVFCPEKLWKSKIQVFDSWPKICFLP